MSAGVSRGSLNYARTFSFTFVAKETHNLRYKELSTAPKLLTHKLE